MRAQLRTLATRLSLLYLALALSAIGIGGAAFWTVKRWGEVLDELSLHQAQALQAEHLRSDVSRLAKELSEVLLADANAPADLAVLRRTIGARLDALHAGAQGERVRSRMERIAALHGRIQLEAGRVLTAMAQGRREDAFRVSEQELEKGLLPELSAAVDDLGAEFLRRADEAKSRAQAAYGTGIALSGLIFALALLQLAVFIGFLQRRFRQPIAIIRRATERMSGGDVSRGVELDRDDELGGIARDITEMARSLRESRERLVQTERLAAVGEVAAYLAHNLRNPLAGIRSAAQAALEETENAALCRETFSDIMRTVDRLSGWAQDILRYVSPTPLQRVPAAAVEVARSVSRLLRGYLAEKEISLRLELEPGLPALALDVAALEQALCAVVQNAAEAEQAGGQIRLGIRRDGTGAVAFSVADRGKGMSPEQLSQARRPFYTTKPKGMGLGLAMADKVAQGHGGDLRVESAPGQGTTVTLRVPSQAG